MGERLVGERLKNLLPVGQKEKMPFLWEKARLAVGQDARQIAGKSVIQDGIGLSMPEGDWKAHILEAKSPRAREDQHIIREAPAPLPEDFACGFQKHCVHVWLSQNASIGSWQMREDPFHEVPGLLLKEAGFP